MIVKNNKPIDEVYKREKKTIGKGTYGDVSVCVHRDTSQKRACKAIAREKIKNWERF